MKKLFIALIILLFSVSFVHAVTIASGSVTRANSRLSLVDGTAFVDFSAAGTLTAYLGQKLTITDSANKKATGYIKAAGTGETLGSELVTNGGFDSDTTGWRPQSCTIDSVAGGQSGNCLQITVSETGQAASYTDVTASVGGLYRASMYVKSGTSGNESYLLQLWFNEKNLYVVGTSSGVWVEAVLYAVSTYTTPNVQPYKYGTTIGTMLFDTVSFKQVLTPSATGVTITSTPNGTTYNWTSIESGFNYNDASGYTYTIESVGGRGSLLLLGVGK